MSVIVKEYCLDDFLRQNPSHLPEKGAIVRVTTHENSSSPAKVQNIVFAEVRSLLCQATHIPGVSGISYTQRQLIGLDLDNGMFHLKKHGTFFNANVQVLDKSELLRLRDPAYKSLDTIEVIEENYFEHIRKVKVETEKSLTLVMAVACIEIVKEFIF